MVEIPGIGVGVGAAGVGIAVDGVPIAGIPGVGVAWPAAGDRIVPTGAIAAGGIFNGAGMPDVGAFGVGVVGTTPLSPVASAGGAFIPAMPGPSDVGSGVPSGRATGIGIAAAGLPLVASVAAVFPVAGVPVP
jgi:hypothetical protein